MLRSRELLADEHGQWMPWLAENFDMNYRTAVNYMAAAEYVARKAKVTSVSHFANIAPTVLYRLAAGEYTAEQEAEILATAKVERVDIARADGICEELCEELEPEEDDLDEETRTLDATREIIEAAKADRSRGRRDRGDPRRAVTLAATGTQLVARHDGVRVRSGDQRSHAVDDQTRGPVCRHSPQQQ